ncbi:hypothetical protein CEXT_316511 [Caerostris extrusa]|uniref:Uncharacterized protein n=1 Tax=Caerostris extrusa TaxID=172846 RepID=A0AAV4TRW4_CAEEX|nr:hypothetical protein CEXT_316511 [Caerostris extrusa]
MGSPVLTEGLFNKAQRSLLHSFYSFSWCIHTLRRSVGMEMSSPSSDSFCKFSSFALLGVLLSRLHPFSSTSASISSLPQIKKGGGRVLECSVPETVGVGLQKTKKR